MQSEFKKLGLEYVPSHGNFILVRVGKGQEVFKQLLAQGVIVRPMGGYRFPEHVRVTVGTMDENRKFIEALQKVITVFLTECWERSKEIHGGDCFKRW